MVKSLRLLFAFHAGGQKLETGELARPKRDGLARDRVCGVGGSEVEENAIPDKGIEPSASFEYAKPSPSALAVAAGGNGEPSEWMAFTLYTEARIYCRPGLDSNHSERGRDCMRQAAR